MALTKAFTGKTRRLSPLSTLFALQSLARSDGEA